MECPKCKARIERSDRYCPECGTKLSLKYFPMGNEWIILALLFPPIGILGGLYYGAHGRKGSWTIVIISLIVWVIYIVIWDSIGL